MNCVLFSLLVLGAWAVVGTNGLLCTPDQWEGNMGALGGYVYHRRPGLINEYATISYDAKNSRSASFVNYVNNDYENKFHIVVRYDDEGDDSGRVYVVDLKKEKCWSKKLEKPFRKACLPADAKTYGDYYLGLKGKDGFLVSGYIVKKKDVTSSVSVQKVGNEIIPIGESLFGTVMRSSFIQTMGFLNLTPGIKNATVFDVPKECKEMNDVSVSEYLLREHMVLGI